MIKDNKKKQSMVRRKIQTRRAKNKQRRLVGIAHGGRRRENTYNSRTHGSAEACKSSKQTTMILLLLLNKVRRNELLATFTRTRSWWRGRREQECGFRDQDDSTHGDRRGSSIQGSKGFLQHNPPQDRRKRWPQKENHRCIRQRHDAKRIEKERQAKRTRKASTE